SATAGTARSVTVSATDLAGNPDPNYSGTVRFTRTDPQADLPADYTFTAADHGGHGAAGGHGGEPGPCRGVGGRGGGARRPGGGAADVIAAAGRAAVLRLPHAAVDGAGVNGVGVGRVHGDGLDGPDTSRSAAESPPSRT